MKEEIKKFIVELIKDTYPKIPEKEEFDYDKVYKKIEEIFSQYNMNGECLHCNKIIVGFYGGFYRNSKGQLFCSHSCIKNNLQNNLD
jgi:hypothetical protein